MANNRGDYIFLDGNTPEEIASHETAGNEFRRFYDELKKIKNGNVDIVEYFLQVRIKQFIQSFFLSFISASNQWIHLILIYFIFHRNV